MMWMVLSLLGYFGNALSTVIDKHILSSRVPNAIAYVFYTGILSVGVYILFLFGDVVIPSSVVVGVIALVSGVSLLAALFFLYEAIRRWEVSCVAPLVGGMSTAFTVVLSALLRGEQFHRFEIAAVLFLLAAAAVLSADERGARTIRWDVVGLSVVSGIWFSVMFVSSDIVFDTEPFISGFVWMRTGSFVAALLMLLVPVVRRSITATHLTTRTGSLWMITGNKLIGAGGFIMLNGAIALGPAALVSALRVSEFVFVFLLAVVFSLVLPSVVRERMGVYVVAQKSIGILLVVLSVYLLSLV